MQNIQSTSRNEKIFIIGHSHGGSAIAYFLKEYPSLAKTLSGCAFLSTPFVAIRPRTQPFHVIEVVSYFPVAAFGVFWGYIARYFGPVDTLSGGLPVYYLGFSLLLALMGLQSFTLRKFRNSEKLLKETRRRQTADLPPGNYLFLRCSGDEAAAALSGAQFIAWLSMRLSKTLELLTRPVFSSRKTVRLVSGGLIGGIMFWASLSSLGLADESIRAFRADMPYLMFLFFYFCVIVLPYLLVLCALAAFLIFLTQALTSWAFGWTEFYTGFFAELAVEPLPFGAHSMVHIDWSADSLGLDGVTHSWTYAHPVCNPVRSGLGQGGVAVPPDIVRRSDWSGPSLVHLAQLRHSGGFRQWRLSTLLPYRSSTKRLVLSTSTQSSIPPRSRLATLSCKAAPAPPSSRRRYSFV